MQALRPRRAGRIIELLDCDEPLEPTRPLGRPLVEFTLPGLEQSLRSPWRAELARPLVERALSALQHRRARAEPDLAGNGAQSLTYFLVDAAIAMLASSLAARAAAARNLRFTWALVALYPAAVVPNLTLSWLLVAATLRTAWLLRRDERRAERRGGDAARLLRRAVGPIDALRRLRKPAVAEGYSLGVDPRGHELSIEFGRASGRHMLLLGASGAGKTNSLTWIAARHIASGFACIVIDMKGDRALEQQLRQHAVANDQPFYSWSLDGDDRWNPLARGNATERKDKLIGSERFSEPHYKRMYERYLLNLFRVLEDRSETVDMSRVMPLLNPDVLLAALRDSADADLVASVSAYLEGLSGDQRRSLTGLADRLSLLSEGESGRYLLPGDNHNELIDLERVITSGGVVLFSLNSSRYPETATLVANLVLQDLKTVCGALEAQPDKKHAALVAIDEFSALSSDHVIGLFQRARSAACSLLVATQEVADLRRIGDAFAEQVIGNVELILSGRQNNPTSAELVSALAGSEEVWQHTLGVGKRARDSKRLALEPLVAPDEIKRLGVGRALLIDKNPHRVELISVPLAPRAETSVEWLAARNQRLRSAAAWAQSAGDRQTA